MHPRDYAEVWPSHLPTSLRIPRTTLPYNLEVAATRYPDKAALLFYGSALTYGRLQQSVRRLAGYLQHRLGVRPGDRILLDLQNCPQFIIAYYAILSADAIVVPVSPMNVTEELAHYLQDSGARVAIFAQDLWVRFEPLMATHCALAIVATYSDYLDTVAPAALPEFMAAAPVAIDHPGVHPWSRALAEDLIPNVPADNQDALCAILYTSGSTGQPKGCMHTHASVLTTAVGSALWQGMQPHSVVLATAPLFHVTGMQHSMNAPLYAAATIVLLSRWDPATAGALIEGRGCTHWANVPTMVVDLLAHPSCAQRDFASLRHIFGGGSAMPEAVAQQLFERCGVRYMEAYGMTETMSQTHMNPPAQLRKQCLGIPTFDTNSIIVDPDSLQPLAPEQMGEIVSCGPQLFLGYWNNSQATQEAFVEIDGTRYLRTGDLGRMDKDGFFYLADRLKRMINANGFKVWPAEVEATLYLHPAIKEVAVVSAPDARRGETVKAYVVPHAGAALTAEALVTWARDHMAAYKIPRRVEFVAALPRSGAGKIQWRTLQEKEWQGH